MSLVPPPRAGVDSPGFGADPRESAEQHRVMARRAARVVAGRAVDARECAELLAMLGIVPGREERIDD